MRAIQTYRVCANPQCRYVAPNQDATRHCPRCGDQVLTTCPHCSHEAAPVAITEKGDFCVQCGQRFKPAPMPKKKTRGCCTPA